MPSLLYVFKNYGFTPNCVVYSSYKNPFLYETIVRADKNQQSFKKSECSMGCL